MELKSLLYKAIDGIKYVLAQPTMMFKRKENVNIIAYHIVRDDEVGRPDLISLEYYNSDSMTDVILKWNGISDPFSLRPGETLEIPDDGVPFYRLDRPSISEENSIKNQFVQGKRQSQKDKNRLDALKKKYNKETLLPPNVIAVGKKNYAFKPDGTVILGAQAQNDAVTESILSDLSVKELIENRIDVLEDALEGLEDVNTGADSGDSLTESQLDKNLAGKSGGGGGKSSNAGKGAGSADPTGGAAGDGTSPGGTGNSNDIANDGAPCN